MVRTEVTFRDPGHVLEEARKFVDSGHVATVGEILQRGAEQFPRSIELLSHLGYFYYKTNQTAHALDTIHRLLELEAPDRNLCLMLADIYQTRHDYAASRMWLNRARALGERSLALRGKLLRARLVPLVDHLIERIRKTPLAARLVRGMKHGMIRLACLGVWILEYIPASRTGIETSFRYSAFLRFLRRYDPVFLHDILAYHKNREIELVCRETSAGAPWRILDIGTGNNPLPLYWAAQGHHAVMLDGSLYGVSALEATRRRMEEDGKILDVGWVAGDALHLPLRDGIFDCVTSICAVEHIPGDGDVQAVREMFRVLRPGGRAIITVETCGRYMETWMEVPYERGYQTGLETPEAGESPWQEVFCRNYSLEEMKSRIAEAAPWRVVRMGFYDDAWLPFRRGLDPMRHPFLAKGLRPFHPLLAKLFYRETPFSPRLSSSSIGYLILEKPR